VLAYEAIQHNASTEQTRKAEDPPMRSPHHFALAVAAVIFLVFAYSFWINAAK
jgi:hypothetical protein